MNRDRLYSEANAYVIRKNADAGPGHKGYTERELDETITLLSNFLMNPKRLITPASIQARIDAIDEKSSPGPANVLFAEALEHALGEYQKTEQSKPAGVGL